MNKFLEKNGFRLLRDSIYFRIHNVIGFDIVEEQYKENYWTVNLSSYMYTDISTYCFEEKNLKALNNPLFGEYWWNLDNKEIYSLYENEILNFFNKYSSIEQMKKCIYFYMNHEYSDESYLNQLKLLFYLDLISGGSETVEEQMKKIKRYIKQNIGSPYYLQEDYENKLLDTMWKDYKQGIDYYEQVMSKKIHDLFRWIQVNNQLEYEDIFDLLDSWDYRDYKFWR
ncbi:hypothetical protein P261_00300 [Lachnospiraceae bacterium TWA4]|nr:hypothetical protein P261_00300 [Lachnospiraceae bacterium TWA4]